MANLGALGKLEPREAQTSAMLRLDSARRASRKAGEEPAAGTRSKGGEIIFASPAVGGPRRRCEADLGALGELDPRRVRTSAMLRRDRARRALREAAERPAAQILRRRKISKIKLGQILICFVVMRVRRV